MNVKGQGLLNAAEWVREAHGPEALAHVLAGCSKAVRQSVASATAADWIPQTEAIELFTRIDQDLGAGDGKLVEEVGAFSARANLRHLTLRLAFFVSRPEFLMRRVAGVWREFNDEGELLVPSFQEGAMVAELAGLQRPDWFFCAAVTGWLREAGEATGMKQLVTLHTECRGRGGAQCLWGLRWARVATS